MLTTADYIVVVFYFVFMTAIGGMFKRFVRNTSDYFRGGGEMLWWICGAGAFMVSFSAVTFTGMSGKAYTDGPIVIVIFIGNAIGFLISYFWFAPLSRQTRAVTAMEVVRARFGKFNEQFFTWLQIPVGTFYAGLWLMGLAVFVSAGFGWSLNATILITGTVVLIMALFGGSWSVSAGDFVQMLVLMPVTIVLAIFSLFAIGGPVNLVHKTPSHFWNWGESANWNIVILWTVATLLQKFLSINSMQDCGRYLSVKDSGHARKAALLGFALFVIGPAVWFIPPMAARVLYPDLSAEFPGLQNPTDAAYFVMAVHNLPVGMTGLLLSGIFGATMSSMDSGLNKNAGYFVKNFYQPYLRPAATEHELMRVSKMATLVIGVLVMLAALTFANLKNLTIFEMMTWFSGLVGVPVSVPLVLGLIFKKAPSWSGWSTVLVGLAVSLITTYFLSSTEVQRYFGWTFNKREASDWTFLSGTFVNIFIPSLYFMATCLVGWEKLTENTSNAPDASELMTLSAINALPEHQRVPALFTLLRTPVDFHAEEGNAGSDNAQAKIMGLLSLIYGSFITLMIFIPNPWTGRIAFAFCGFTMLAIGGLLYRAGTKAHRTAQYPALSASDQKTPAVVQNI